MFEAITAWATLVIAVCTIAGVYVAYRAMLSQAKSLAASVSADLALKLTHDIDSDANKARPRVYRAPSLTD
jgi:cbb3-type cytochrome oxidase subunit 3